MNEDIYTDDDIQTVYAVGAGTVLCIVCGVEMPEDQADSFGRCPFEDKE